MKKNGGSRARTEQDASSTQKKTTPSGVSERVRVNKEVAIRRDLPRPAHERTLPPVHVLRPQGLGVGNGPDRGLDGGQELVDRERLRDERARGRRRRLLTLEHRHQVVPEADLLLDGLDRELLELELEGLVRRGEDGALEQGLEARPHLGVGRHHPLDRLLEEGRGRSAK
jgi:hypothetical protein